MNVCSHLDGPSRAGGTFLWGCYAKGGNLSVSFGPRVQVCRFCLLGEQFVCVRLQDGSIFVTCRSTLKVIESMSWHTRAILALVSVGEILISGSEDGDIMAWDITSDSRLGPDRCMRVFQAHHGRVTPSDLSRRGWTSAGERGA